MLVAEGNHWKRWPVEGSHLTLKGAALETLFGEYFRLWLNSEGVALDSASIYFGASSKQRTIATARCFAAGMLPLITVPIDYKVKEDGNIGYLDPDYLPLLNDQDSPYFDTTAFKLEAYKEIGTPRQVSYKYLEKVLNFNRSPLAKQRRSTHFNDTVGVNLTFYGAEGKRLEPTISGDLALANKASDAMILQYYEEDGSKVDLFGQKLSFRDFQRLAEIKDNYDDILFTPPILAVNISHCMLIKIHSEMMDENHIFSFLCSHDSMIGAVLSALQVHEYVLSGTIEGRTPIGVKFLIEQWCDEAGYKYIRPRLVYQSSAQIRHMAVLDLNHPPMFCDLSFAGLEKTPTGMYRFEDFIHHIERTIDAYNKTASGQYPF